MSELLGSFGDNELSPECLDGAQRLLKDDGISIPSSYVYFYFEVLRERCPLGTGFVQKSALTFGYLVGKLSRFLI